MSARPASSVRRGSATMSVAPRSCARLMAAPNTGCHSVADVHVEALQQRQLAHRLARRARRRARLGPLALAFDGLPRAAAALRAPTALPHPTSALSLPAPADQGLREPVVVLREVVSETPFHARRALVRRVELDVR